MKDFILDEYIATRESYSVSAEGTDANSGHYAIAYALMALACEARMLRQDLVFGSPEDDAKGVLEQMVIEVRDGFANLAAAIQYKETN